MPRGFKRRNTNSGEVRNVVDPDSSDLEAQEEFKAEDCDSDFDEERDEAKRVRRQKREQAAAHEAKMIIPKSYQPSSCKKLSACIYCKFILNREKWVKLEQCPNCPQSKGLTDTTENWSNLIGSVYPRVSWVAQWQQMRDEKGGVSTAFTGLPGANSGANKGFGLPGYGEGSRQRDQSRERQDNLPPGKSAL